MSSDLLSMVLVVLTFAVALNLALTFRLAARVFGADAPREKWIGLPAGGPLPDFEGEMLRSRVRATSNDLLGRPAVLVFLSAGCPKCRKKLEELKRVFPLAREAGVTLWILSPDPPERLFQLLDGSELLDQALVVDDATLIALNPNNASPFYIFVDHRKIVQASNFIDDPDWRSFVEQIEYIEPERRVV